MLRKPALYWALDVEDEAGVGLGDAVHRADLGHEQVAEHFHVFGFDLHESNCKWGQSLVYCIVLGRQVFDKWTLTLVILSVG